MIKDPTEKKYIHKSHRLRAEIIKGIGIIFASVGGVFCILSLLDWSEASTFKQKGRVDNATVIKKYTEKISSIGRRRALRKSYRVDVYYWDSFQSRNRETKIAKKINTLENIDKIGQLKLKNLQTGTIEKINREQFEAIAENSEIAIYYIPDSDGKVALKDWVDNYNLLSSCGTAIISIGAGIGLFILGNSTVKFSE